MLAVDRWPELREPLMVVALSGWVDGGSAGAGAVAALLEQLEGRVEFAAIDVTDLADLQQIRPVARFEAGQRRIDWPRITFEAGHGRGGRARAGRDVIVVRGPEPSLRWPSVAAAVVEVAQRLGVRQAATVGGIPALVSHRRPAVVLASGTRRSLVQEVPPARPDYAGPTGLQTAVLRALGDAGVAGLGLWVQVPQYVSGSPSPPSVRALLDRLSEVYHLDLDFRALDDRCRSYLRRVEAGLAARPDVKAVVDQMDEGVEPASGDLVAEIEQFLRSRSDGDEPPA